MTVNKQHKKDHGKVSGNWIIRIIFAVLVVAAIVVLTGAAFKRIVQSVEKNCSSILEKSAKAVNNEIILRFEDNINTLRLMSGVMVRSDDLESDEAVTERINEFCDKTIFDHIDVFYPDNTLLLQNGTTMDASGSLSFEEISARGEHMSARTGYLADESKHIICYCVPVVDEGETAAVIIGVIECSQLSDIFKADVYDGQAYMCIIDRKDGSFILDNYHDEPGDIYMYGGAATLRKGYEPSAIVTDIMDGNTGVTVYESDEKGQSSYVYYTPVGIFDWQLVLVVQEDVVFARLREMDGILAGIGIGELVILTLYFGFFLVSTIRRERSRRKVEKQLTVSNTLVECISVLSNNPDTGEAINKVLEIVASYFRAERAYLFEIDYDNQTVSNTYEYVAEGVSEEIDNLQNVPISAVDEWIRQFRENGMFRIKDVETDVDRDSDVYEILKAQNINSLIAVPIYKDGAVIGFFGVDNPTVNYENLSLITSATFFLSDSLEKRQYHEMLERLSYEDALTKMYNRNKFNEEVELLQKNRPEKIGVAYIDMNGLKDANDRFGHQAGDELIKRVASSISGVFKENAFRIGGDEFIIIVSDIEKDIFYDNIEKMILTMKESQLSVSIGVSWTESGEDIITQIRNADERMYEEKNQYYKFTHQDRKIYMQNRE